MTYLRLKLLNFKTLFEDFILFLPSLELSRTFPLSNLHQYSMAQVDNWKETLQVHLS